MFVLKQHLLLAKKQVLIATQFKWIVSKNLFQTIKLDVVSLNFVFGKLICGINYNN